MSAITTPRPDHDELLLVEPLEERPLARGWWWMIIVAGLAGVVSGIIQIVDKIAYEGGTKGADAVCEISAIVSCSSVYSHWQSSALGVPNATIGMPLFALITSAGLAGLMGSRLSRVYLATIFGLTVFFASFITWYMTQMAYPIGALCIYCSACMVAVILVGMGVTRAADAGLALGTGKAGQTLRSFVHGRTDLLIWGGWLVIVAALIWFGLFF